MADRSVLYIGNCPNVYHKNLMSVKMKLMIKVNVEDLPHDLQEEAIELQFNSLAKDSFEKYPKISSQSLRILVPFSSTYLCETGFSALMTLNTQHRNRLNVESDLRCTLCLNVEDLPHDLQEEAIELQFNSLAKDSFEKYPKISSQSLRILVPFSSTYLCETGFSALMTLNTQHRNRLNVESDLRCTLSPTPPRIDNLVANKHCQYSH
ncbi:SCAN domain-containing protein 3 [Trichinella sp. T9]|nr:SCAN domain-containing protein 3 [Trichinella sp. T9]